MTLLHRVKPRCAAYLSTTCLLSLHYQLVSVPGPQFPISNLTSAALICQNLVTGLSFPSLLLLSSFPLPIDSAISATSIPLAIVQFDEPLPARCLFLSALSSETLTKHHTE